jgi:hypothetical protein
MTQPPDTIEAALAEHLDRTPAPTESMLRSRRWLAESREEAAKAGQALDVQTVAWFEHIAACPRCELRESMDPALCDVAAAVSFADGDDEARPSGDAGEGEDQ